MVRVSGDWRDGNDGDKTCVWNSQKSKKLKLKLPYSPKFEKKKENLAKHQTSSGKN